jgi:hypothetical protein
MSARKEKSELMKLAIVFATREQAVAYAVEMSGQVSDGQWENSRPFNHWEDMCSAEIGWSADKNKQGVYGFHPARKYNFANRELFEIVGKRCRNTVVLYNMYPTLKVDDHWDYSFLTESDCSTCCMKELGNKEKYWREKHKRALAAIGITAKQAVQVWDEMTENSYSLKDLRKDLKEMNRIVNNRNTNGYQSFAHNSKEISWLK